MRYHSSDIASRQAAAHALQITVRHTKLRGLRGTSHRRLNFARACLCRGVCRVGKYVSFVCRLLRSPIVESHGTARRFYGHHSAAFVYVRRRVTVNWPRSGTSQSGSQVAAVGCVGFVHACPHTSSMVPDGWVDTLTVSASDRLRPRVPSVMIRPRK